MTNPPELGVDDPMLMMHRMAYRTADSLDMEGNPTGSAIVLTFDGDTLVDGQKVAETSSTVIVPSFAYADMVYTLLQNGINNGLIMPHPRQPCGSELLQPYAEMAGGRRHDDHAGTIWHVRQCARVHLHPGHHLDELSNVWDDRQAQEARTAFESVLAREAAQLR